jgi:hypothetical protein
VGGRGIPPLTDWQLPTPRVQKDDGYVGFLQVLSSVPGPWKESIAPLPAPSGVVSDRPYVNCAVVGRSSVLNTKGCVRPPPSPLALSPVSPPTSPRDPRLLPAWKTLNYRAHEYAPFGRSRGG